MTEQIYRATDTNRSKSDQSDQVEATAETNAATTERAAKVSEDAACCLLDIDQALQEAEQSERERAMAERHEISRQYANALRSGNAHDYDQASRAWDAWKVRYAHLEDGSCVC